MSDYTPTDDELREKYATPWHETADYTSETEMAEFDRWLAAHDAQVRAETLRKFADTLTHKGVYTLNIHDIRKYAREEAGL